MSSETEVDHLVLEHLRGIRGDVAKLGLKIPTPRRSRASRASHAVVRSRASLMRISSVFRRDGDGVEVEHAASAGHRGSGRDGAGDIEQISSGQRSHLQGLCVAAHVVRSTPAHPCGAGRKSLWADARRAIRRTGRFGRESYGGTPKSGFRLTFSPYARFEGTGLYGKNRRSSPRTGPRKALAVFPRKRCTSDRASCRRVHEIGRGQGIQEPFEVRPRRLPVLDPPVAQGFIAVLTEGIGPLGFQDRQGPLHDGPNAGALPLCSATAPALSRFDEEYRSRGLVCLLQNSRLCADESSGWMKSLLIRRKLLTAWRFPCGAVAAAGLRDALGTVRP
jgi:hypothetical protein